MSTRKLLEAVGNMLISMANPLAQLETDCTSIGKQVKEHMLKIYLYPNNQAQNHWRTELRDFIDGVCYRTKAKAKPASIHTWMFEDSAPISYDTIVEKYGQPSVSLEDAEQKIKPAELRISAAIAVHNNLKSGRTRFSDLDVKRILDL